MSDEAKELERGEKRVRFGCGFVFGILGGGGTIFFLLDDISANAKSIGIIVVWALVCGLLSARFGDRFWNFLAAWWRGTRGGFPGP